MRFYLSMTCDGCGEDIYLLVMTLLEHNDLPVVPFDMAAQAEFTCDCGMTYFTGDFNVMSEATDEH